MAKSSRAVNLFLVLVFHPNMGATKFYPRSRKPPLTQVHLSRATPFLISDQMIDGCPISLELGHEDWRANPVAAVKSIAAIRFDASRSSCLTSPLSAPEACNARSRRPFGGLLWTRW